MSCPVHTHQKEVLLRSLLDCHALSRQRLLRDQVSIFRCYFEPRLATTGRWEVLPAVEAFLFGILNELLRLAIRILKNLVFVCIRTLTSSPAVKRMFDGVNFVINISFFVSQCPKPNTWIKLSRACEHQKKSMFPRHK